MRPVRGLGERGAVKTFPRSGKKSKKMCGKPEPSRDF